MLTRESLISRPLAVPVAVSLPIASGIGRVYLDRHWATDGAAGWLAGGAVAVFGAAG